MEAAVGDECEAAHRILARNGTPCAQVVRCFSAGDPEAECIDGIPYETVLYVTPTKQARRALLNASIVMQTIEGW